MNSALLICVSFIAAAYGLGNDTEWEAYKTKHTKQYNNDEELYRKEIWRANLKFIEEHNANETGFKLEINDLGDLTPIEYRSLRLGARYPGNDTKNCGVTFEPQGGMNLPDSVDWRKRGYVTPVKNQGPCGSCWAFSATGSLEGQHFNKTGTLVSLSEQNLVDCSGSYGNHGCQGGWPDNAFNYIKNNGGIDTEASYPYRAIQQPCQFSPSTVGATVSGLKNIQQFSEQDLEVAVATVGPISVAIDASHQSFQLYRSGVYYQPGCSSTRVDHAVLVVGYGTTSTGEEYWLVKNSWGVNWGMSGYIWMARNRNNNCAIATFASYPLVNPLAEADRKFVSTCEGASKNAGGPSARLFSQAKIFAIILFLFWLLF